ncbi:hypothetical protein BH10PSE12_BH10PSE12_27160 [soil metagenome]
MTAGQTRAAFWAILALALVLRLYALSLWSIHHPDEIFQYLEPAHRIVFGQGVVTWEYRYGMRGWLLPLLLAGPMALGEAIQPGGGLYLLLPRIMVSLVSLGIPIGAFLIGRRMSPTHGMIAMAVMALWFESVYFSSHVLTEMLAVAVFLPAAGMMLGQKDDTDRRQFLFAGFLLGLAAILRFHYLPAFAIFALMTCGTHVHARWLPLIIGGLLAAAVSAVADGIMGQIPFAWIAENFQQNVVLNRAADYGVDPPLAYFAMLAIWWGVALPVIFLLMTPAISANRALLITALVALAVHMAIGHKEYRFIMLPATLFVLLAALGSAQWNAAWTSRIRQSPLWLPPVAVCAIWASVSIGLAMTGAVKDYWSEYRPQLELSRLAAKNPALCGIALHHLKFWETGGYTYLHHDVPIYITDIFPADRLTLGTNDRRERAFNAVIASETATRSTGSPWQRKACIGAVCLLERPGGCDSAAGRASEINALLRRLDM